MKPSASLDTWRDYFQHGDSDIFGIIEHAIMVAATDSPEELKTRRDTIVELLFSCPLSRCIGCHQPVETVGVDSGGHEEDEMKLNVNQIVDEVMRIKDILLNKHDEPSVLFESMTKLASMSISMDLIKGSEIGKAVNRLRKHGSNKISKLAKTLIEKWKEMVDQLINMPKEVAAADDGTPKSATLSIVDEAKDFPPLPHDLDFYDHEPTAFELSQILDSLDCDGNLRDSAEPKHERKLRSNTMKKHEGTYEANVVERGIKNQQATKKEVDVRLMRHSTFTFDEPRRQPKQTREQMVHTFQRQSIVVVEQKLKLVGSQQDKLKALDPEAKFENAKQRLQESYQQHEKAKRQRTIQILETIPNQRKTQKPLLKRSVRR
ncbi:hypothetical protein N665_0257s0059 [Sinapis alba]|nr:hypothetical protein N665_0257s0059 [Sinapis alba]